MAAAVAMPAMPAVADGDEVLLELGREYHRRVDYCNNNEALTDEEVAYLAGRARDIAHAIIDTPARTPAGIAVKLRLHANVACWDLTTNEPPGDLGMDPIWSAYADLERLAGGVS